jgi:hypothetical protein
MPNKLHNFTPLLVSEFGETQEGLDQTKLDKYLGSVDLEAVGREGGTTGAKIQFNSQLIIMGILRIGYNKVHLEITNENGWEQEIVDLGMMQYSVYTLLSVTTGLWHGEIKRDDVTVFSGNCSDEDEKKSD